MEGLGLRVLPGVLGRRCGDLGRGMERGRGRGRARGVWGRCGVRRGAGQGMEGLGQVRGRGMERDRGRGPEGAGSGGDPGRLGPDSPVSWS